MIFHWGTKEKKITDTIIDTALCPHCASNQFEIFGWITYIHIFWIPIYVRFKKLIILCNRCRKPISEAAIPEDLLKQTNSLAFPFHKVAFFFSGLFLFILLLFYGYYLHFNQKNLMLTYISEPLINDVYLVQLNKIASETKKFGFIKIENIETDTVVFKVSKISYNKYRDSFNDLSNLNAYQSYYYLDKTIIIPVDKLKEYFESGFIESIKRNINKNN